MVNYRISSAASPVELSIMQTESLNMQNNQRGVEIFLNEVRTFGIISKKFKGFVSAKISS